MVRQYHSVRHVAKWAYVSCGNVITMTKPIIGTCTRVEIFVKDTSRGYSVTVNDVASFTMHNYYPVCQIHQLWQHQDNELGSF